MTDGLFHKVFDEVAAGYPEIQNEHWIVDIGAAKMADTPETFDVIVMPNLYGDILSDVAAQIAGSVGLAGSANIGDHCAMFEAIHGSAPRRANQNLANPSGLLLGAVLMLVHINQPEVAERVHNGWLRAIEEGVHTYDVFDERVSKQKVGTKEFADAVIARLGRKPERLKAAAYAKAAPRKAAADASLTGVTAELVGVDIFVEHRSRVTSELAGQLQPLGADGLSLTMMDNRGVKVWPEGMPETFCSDSYRCRFLAEQGKTVKPQHIAALLQRLADNNVQVAKAEYLRNYEGQPGFTLAQGQ
jgi:isocitrate dehydrogenase